MCRRLLLPLCLLVALAPLAARMTEARAADALDAVVGLKVTVPAQSRSASTLGTERTGSGVVIDASGLIVTIGYLILEASGIEVTVDGRTVPATTVGYDHNTGFGLVRSLVPLNVKPMALGSSRAVPERDTVIAAGAGGTEGAQPVMIVSKRKFAGYWEYMLDEAIFTSPPMANFGGAALIGSDGKLLGIGSLIVADALPDPRFPGNMFVPIDLLKPILADLLTMGRSSAPPRPWLGITSEATRGRVVVARVSAESPAQKAGIEKGDVIVAVGGKAVRDLSDFYNTLWGIGPAGAEITLTLMRAAAVREITVKSIDRLDFLKAGNTF